MSTAQHASERKRQYLAPCTEDRCVWTVPLRGAGVGSNDVAQCMRAKKDGDLCAQHAKMAARWSCEYCGGNDELPPDHCMDCARPATIARTTGSAS